MVTKSSSSQRSRAGDVMTATLSPAFPSVPHPGPQHPAHNGDGIRGNARRHDGDPLPPLSREEVLRYSRHLILPDVGLEGQQRLKAARVLLIGAGGLGSPLALYLAAAGVGTLGLVDFDVVDVTNLHRQVLYGHHDIGRPKLAAAVERLSDINPHIRIVPHELKLEASNALELFAGYDIVADGSDNFPTRYLVNDACIL